jgi:hypothetical protein
MIPKDRLGRDIVAGSYIAYGHALGRCAGLRIGKVLHIKSLEKEGYTTTIIDWRITVMGVDDDWNHRAPELCKRKGTLMFPDRMVVLDFDKLPQVYQDLLKEFV